MDLLPMLAAASGAGGETDDDFASTVLLLHGDGTNGAQNNTFLDSSTNNFTITRNGNTTQGVFSPYSKPDGGWGNYFGSNTANLKFASNAAFAIGTGNFTVECFVNFDAWASTNQRILMQDVSGGSTLQIGRDSGANNLFIVITGSTVINYSWSPTVGEFYHIAVVRSGTGTNEVALYIDGVSVATGTSNGSISQQQVIVGGLDWATGYNIQGYISNFRYSNVARTITVPTAPYTSDANTLILTCQSNRFLDNSSNAFAVTVNGTVKVTPFSLFPITTEYSPSVNGGSGYFDGSGDYLSVASDTDFDCGTGNWTLETWVYILSENNAYPIICGNANASYATAGSLAFGNHNTDSATYNNKFIITGKDSDLRFADATTHPLNTWIHIAVVRDSATTLKMYRDGVQVASTTIASGYTFNWGLNGFRVGGGNWDGANRSEINAYISNLRLIKGQSLTTGSFTPPIAPLQAGVVGWTGANVAASVTGTEAIINNFSNAGIFDNTNFNVLESVGNSQINTTTKKYGTGSLSFDGTGDWLLMPHSPDQQLGTGDFTIEFWVYLATGDAGSNRGLVAKGTSTTGFLVSLNTTEKVVFTFTTSTITSTGAITLDAWNHIAVVREGTGSNETKIYIGGTNDGTGTVSTDFNQTSVMYVGANRTGGDPMKGYIDDLRISRIARYTTTFTPPAKAFPNIGA